MNHDRRNSVVMEELTNKQSELSKFLKVDSSKDSGDESNRSMSLTSCVETITSFIRSPRDYAYVLACEPIEVRRERVVMLAEAFTIFGGLFLGGTFILYEWGINPINESNVNMEDYRYFGAILAVLICCNIFLTLWSSLLWLSAIVYGSHKDFVYSARKLIGFCSGLLGITLILITAGCISAIHINLGMGNPESIILTGFVIILQMTGVYYFNYMNLAVAPLAICQVPELLRVFYCPAMLTAKGREKLKISSKEQSNNLRAKVNAEREKLKDDKDLINSDISLLLRTAATNLGRENHDISIYANRLKDEWFDDPKQLLGESVVLLSRYMPYRLAKELHRLVEAEFLESSLYSYEINDK